MSEAVQASHPQALQSSHVSPLPPARQPHRKLPRPVAEAWDWQLLAACRGIDTKVFFAPDAERGLRRLARERVAKAVCSSCPVMSACAEYAVRTREPFGVWGGLTPDERRRLWSADRARTA